MGRKLFKESTSTGIEHLEGIWRLVDCRAWDEGTNRLSAPYGAHPMGQTVFSHGRMLASLCNGDVAPDGDRRFSAFGGRYKFDGTTLEVIVDVASDPARVGSCYVVQEVVMIDQQQMLMRPPSRLYGKITQRREYVWERVWSSSGK